MNSTEYTLFFVLCVLCIVLAFNQAWVFYNARLTVGEIADDNVILAEKLRECNPSFWNRSVHFPGYEELNGTWYDETAEYRD